MRTIVGSTIALMIVGASYACGGDTIIIVHNTPDGGTVDPDAGVVDPDAAPPPPPPNTNYPAFAVDAPQVVSNNGPQLANAEIVPVFFSNDDATLEQQVVAFLGKLPNSTYWGPPTKEYGVGTPSIKPQVVLAEAAPTKTDDMTIQSWLASKITAGALPPPNANTLYMLYYPSGSTISDGQGTSCSSFGGYHNSIAYKGSPVAYGVIPRCATFGPLTGVNVITGTSTHEIIEAVTDPFPQQQPGYGQVDANHIIWQFVLGGGETGDMCAQFPNAFFKSAELGNAAQRCWSNKAAKAGHDPCVPGDGTPYFNTVPVLPDSVSLGGGQITTKAVKIPVGQSKTIELDLFSDAPTSGPWFVAASDTAAQQGQPAQLDFTLDKQSGQNGDKIMLTIKVLKASQFNAEPFILTSSLGGRDNLWIGLVAN